MWLRITEIIIGLIVLVLGGYVVAYPGVAAATLIGFLAVGILISKLCPIGSDFQKASDDGSDFCS